MESWQVFEIDSHEDLELCKDLSKIKLVDEYTMSIESMD